METAVYNRRGMLIAFNQCKILNYGEQNYPHLLVVLVIFIFDDAVDDDWSGNVFVEISSKCFPLKEGAAPTWVIFVLTISGAALRNNLAKARKMQNILKPIYP